MIKTIAALLLGGFLSSVHGHGDLGIKIEKLTLEIAQDPTNATLYLRRANLHRLHKDWDAALADLQQLAMRMPGDPKVLILRGQVYFDAGFTLAAKTSLEQFLAVEPDHAEGWLQLARIRARRGLNANSQYDRHVVLAKKVDAGMFLEWARAVSTLEPQYLKRSLEVLDRGIAAKGSVWLLEEEAIAYHVKLQQFDKALKRLDAILKASHRLERWLDLRARILFRAGRIEQAEQAWRDCLKTIERLPERIRRQSSVVTLHKSVRERLGKFGA